MNSLYQQMNQPSNIKNQVLGTITRNNPQIAQIMQEVKQNGGDAKALFYRKAREMGVDPQAILNQLR